MQNRKSTKKLNHLYIAERIYTCNIAAAQSCKQMYETTILINMYLIMSRDNKMKMYVIIFAHLLQFIVFYRLITFGCTPTDRTPADLTHHKQAKRIANT